MSARRALARAIAHHALADRAVAHHQRDVVPCSLLLVFCALAANRAVG